MTAAITASALTASVRAIRSSRGEIALKARRASFKIFVLTFQCDVANCAVADCNGHGKCVNGICLCVAGWKGVECEEGVLSVV